MPLALVPWLIGGGVTGGAVWGAKNLTESVGKWLAIAVVVFLVFKVVR